MKKTTVKLLALSLFGLLSATVTAQTSPGGKIQKIQLKTPNLPVPQQEHDPKSFCYSDENYATQTALYPNEQSREQFEAMLSPLVARIEADRAAGRNIQSTYNIPVVIHVIHDGDALGSGENITDAQAISQINVLNLAYNTMDAVYNSTGVNFSINFCIAQTDPNGVATTGVEHVVKVPPTDDYPNSSYQPLNMPNASTEKDWEYPWDIATMKTQTSWDPTRYMNFWTVRLANHQTAGSSWTAGQHAGYGAGNYKGVLGFCTFPNMPAGGTPNDLPSGTGIAGEDGALSVFDGMGNKTDPAYQSSWLLNPNWQTGKTMVHEVGHFLGLYHPFQGGCSTPNDYCNDTAQQNAAVFGCTNQDTCPSDGQGNDPYHNHMVYSDESCRTQFTPNQISRAQAVMQNAYRRSTLTASTACQTATPIIKYEKTTGSTIENTNCSYTDVPFKIFIGKGASKNADITFNVTGGTATQGIDYQFIPATVQFAAGSLTAQNMTVRVFHDGIIEGDETINVSLVLNANGGDATLDPAAKDMVITITDNDFAAVAVATNTIFTEGFENATANTNVDPDCTQIDADGDGIPFFYSNSFNGQGGITGLCGLSPTDKTLIGGTGTAIPDNYLILKQFSIPAGVDSASLSYLIGDYTGGGTAYQEHYSVYFATNITSAATIQAGTVLVNDNVLAAADSVSMMTIPLPAGLLGQTGYLVFRHKNPSATGNGALLLDNVTVTTTKTTNVQTAVNTATAYNGGIPQTGTANATDTTSGNIMASITDNDNANYGCATVSVSRDAATAGAAAVDYGTNTATSLKVMAKVIKVITGTVNPTANATIAFYFTNAEITAWETATGNVRANLKVFKASDTNYIATTLGAFGTNVTLTATFATGAAGDYYFGIPPTPITAVATTVVNSTCSLSNGSVTIGAVTGGIAPYTYSFNGSAFTGTTNYPNLAAGSYTIIVKDTNGSTYTTSVTVTNTTGPTAVATTIVNASCGAANGSVTIGAVTGGNAPYTYSFNGTGFTATTSYTGLITGSYPLIVKDANGCTYNTTVTITNAAGPTAVATTIVNGSCGTPNGSVTIGTVTGGAAPFTYNFNSLGYSATTNYTGLAAGSYTIIVKDANGCTFNTTVVITNTSGPSAIATTISNASCGASDGSVTLGTVTGGVAPYTYNFNNLGYSATTSYPGLSAGSYTLNVKDANGCIYTTSVAISNTTGVTAIATTVVNETCGSANGSITLGTETGGTPPYTYNFNGGGYSATTSYTGLPAGTYSIDVKDANGCIYSTSVAISNAGGPTALATTIVNETCGSANGTLSLGTVTGGVAPYNYDFNSLGYSATTSYTGLIAGTYTVNVKDANGCIYTTTVTINNTTGVTAVATTVVDATCGASNGSITIGTVTGGTPGYTYDFNGLGYSSTTTYSALSAGSYTLNVKDANSCIYTTTVSISNTGGATAIATTIVNTTCGSANGSITLGTVTGGTAPYTYDFNGAGYSATTSYTGLTAGSYTVNVKDANGCTYTTSITVIDNPGPTAIATTVSGNTVTITGVTGGTPPYTYSYNGSAYTSTTVYTGTGSTDTINVMDVNGCIFSTTVLGVSTFDNNQFSVYPNPTTGIITMTLKDNTSLIDTIQVTDVLGQIIQHKTIHSSSTTIDLSNLSNGLYFIKVKSDNQEKVVKVIKQ